jgi:hypothetical protein
MRKETTKVCKCGNTYLVLLPSLNKKYCTECQTYIPWYLANGQKSPTTSQVGGKIEPIISTISKTNEIETENLPVGESMQNKKCFNIQLTRITQEQLSKFLKLFRELNDVPVPSNLEKTIINLLNGNDQELYLEVAHDPLSLTVCDVDGTQQFAPINEVLKVFEAAIDIKQAFGQIKDGKSEPEPSTTAVNYEPESNPNTQPAVGKKGSTAILTVEEAAYEFQEVWRIIAATLTRLEIVIPGMSRIEHVRIAMALLERYETGGTTH